MNTDFLHQLQGAGIFLAFWGALLGTVGALVELAQSAKHSGRSWDVVRKYLKRAEK